MGKKGNGRIEKARAEIERLKARRRLDLIKILAALAAMMLILLGKPMLENAGIIEADNMVVNGAMWISAFILAIFAGSAGRDLSKCGRSIDEVRTRAGLWAITVPDEHPGTGATVPLHTPEPYQKW